MISKETLATALSAPIWETHKIGDTYTMDNKPDAWKMSYYPIFEDGKTHEMYDEPRALVERPIKVIEKSKTALGGQIVKEGIDFREVPLRYLTKIQ